MLYFKFFNCNGYTELHTGRNKNEVEKGLALNKKVPNGSPAYDKVVEDMEAEVEFWLNDVKNAQVLPPEGFSNKNCTC